MRFEKIMEADEVSLYTLVSAAMAAGLDLREVVVSYAGCGSHNVLVQSMEAEAHLADEETFVPTVGPAWEWNEKRKQTGDLVPGHDGEVGF